MMRKNSLFILLLVALLSLPAFAFADASTDELSGGKGVGWQGIISSGDDAGLYGVVGRARNKYNMACWVFGKNPLTIPDEVRSKLSDPNYGGRFYEYANTFTSVISWEYVPDWQPTYSTLTYVWYGFDFQWNSAVPKSLYEGAKEDFRRVLAGEDLGGGSGGSGPDVSGGLDIPFTWGSDNVIFSSKMNNKASFSAASGSATLRLTSSQASNVCSYQYVVVGLYMVSPGIYGTPSNATFVFSVFGTNNPSPSVTQNSSSMANVQAAGGTRFDYGNGNASKTLSAYNGGVFTPTSQSSSSSLSGWMLYYSVIPVGDFSPEPDGDWPEPEPTPTPTAPEVPTPTAPTVTPDPTLTEPTSTWPVITTPTAPTVVTVVTPEGLDYTQLLTLINDNLNDINSYTVAINSSLNSLRSDLVTEFEGVTQGLRNIYQYLQHLDDLLERHCKHLRDALDDGIYNLELYIKSLFEWLPRQLEFDAKFDYDDTAVTSLLRRILSKIPGGSGDSPTSYMPNPQADEPGFFDWLTDLWHRFLIDLVSVLPDELGGLVDAFSQLTHYFPFSIPWDLAALLALFEHEPVTPVFDVPWGFGGDEGEIEMVRVDLSAWDGVMEMVRPVFLVGFCWQLAMITKELLANFDIKQGGV